MALIFIRRKLVKEFYNDIRAGNIEHIPVFFLFYSGNENLMKSENITKSVDKIVSDIVQSTIFNCKKIF